MPQIFPKRAFILAAGLSTRLRPLSFDTPKPLLPIWNTPILERLLNQLRAWGVQDVLINLHYQAGAILEYLRRRSCPPLRIAFSFEPEILGTGGALRRADWFFADRDAAPFLLINADIAFELNLQPLVNTMHRHNPLAVLWLVKNTGPRTVEMRGNTITSFHSTTPGSERNFTFTGVHIVHPKILRYLPATGYASIIDAYMRAQSNGEKIMGVCPPATCWHDLGTPENYVAAHQCLILRRKHTMPSAPHDAKSAAPAHKLQNFSCACATDVVISPAARVRNAVVWSGAKLGPKATVVNAVIGRNCVIHHHVPGLAINARYLPADTCLDLALAHLGWPRENVCVIPLEKRGSAREFTRLTCGQRSAIMIHYSLERSENALYARHNRLLQEAGVHTPRLLLDVPRHKMLLLEDLGNISLAERLNAGTAAKKNAAALRLYQAVLENTLRLHTTAAHLAERRRHPLMPGFTPKLYRWEREFFQRHFLARYPKICNANRSRKIMEEFANIAAVLQKSPYGLIHRDLQSTNVLFRGKTPCFIDFQGMRRGPIAYDLASLLCDPYVELPESFIVKSLAYYNRRAPRACRVSEQIFWCAAVERLAQALGAYGRLVHAEGIARFARFIPPALRQMQTALQHLPGFPQLKETVPAILALK